MTKISIFDRSKRKLTSYSRKLGYSGFGDISSTRNSIRSAANGFGFGRGLCCCIVRDVPSFGAFFCTYEVLIGKPNWLGYQGNYGFQSPEEIIDFSKILVKKILKNRKKNVNSA